VGARIDPFGFEILAVDGDNGLFGHELFEEEAVIDFEVDRFGIWHRDSGLAR